VVSLLNFVATTRRVPPTLGTGRYRRKAPIPKAIYTNGTELSAKRPPGVKVPLVGKSCSYRNGTILGSGWRGRRVPAPGSPKRRCRRRIRPGTSTARNVLEVARTSRLSLDAPGGDFRILTNRALLEMEIISSTCFREACLGPPPMAGFSYFGPAEPSCATKNL
jgi:hypothetical protein